VTAPTRVVLADDHRFFRDGVRLVLDAAPDIEVVGEAATGEEAIAQTEAAQPDVVIMDVSMPGRTVLMRRVAFSTAFRVSRCWC
jgi:DNA-binding NarL/FixJ family response regulator